MLWSSIAQDKQNGPGLFPAERDGLALLATAVRSKTFLHIRVYAVALYVGADCRSSLASSARGADDRSAYRTLLDGDIELEVVLTALRRLSAHQIQGAFRKHLENANDRDEVRRFLAYFDEGVRRGESCVLRRRADGTLEVTVQGVAHPRIGDRRFVHAVLSMWLSDDAEHDFVTPEGRRLR